MKDANLDKMITRFREKSKVGLDDNIRNVSLNCCYGVMKSDNSDVVISSITYCAAGLHTGEGNIILHQIQESPLHDVEIERLYWEWLLNFSPYADVFVSKDINKVLKDRVVILRHKYSPHFTRNAVIAFRYPWENHGGNLIYLTTLTWRDLVKAGVHPNFAFTLCNLAWRNSSHEVMWASGNSNHQPVQVTTEIWQGRVRDLNDTHLNFFQNKPNTQAENTRSIWSKNSEWNDLPINSTIREAVNSVKMKEKKSNNPFEQNKVVNVLTFDKVTPVLIEAAKDLQAKL